jgi:hypothetical protein
MSEISIQQLQFGFVAQSAVERPQELFTLDPFWTG